MKRLILFTIIATGCVCSCQKSDDGSALGERIIGNWLVIGKESVSNDEGVTVRWGLYYLHMLSLKMDHAFTVDGNEFSAGFWKLGDNDQRITFYSMVNGIGTTYRDTTEFAVSIDNNDQLILSNDQGKFIHRRIP